MGRVYSDLYAHAFLKEIRSYLNRVFSKNRLFSSLKCLKPGVGGIFCPLTVTSGFCPLEACKTRPVFYRGGILCSGLSPGFGEKRLKSGFFELASIKADKFCPLDF